MATCDDKVDCRIARRVNCVLPLADFCPSRSLILRKGILAPREKIISLARLIDYAHRSRNSFP